jgi:hypothetical protein
MTNTPAREGMPELPADVKWLLESIVQYGSDTLREGTSDRTFYVEGVRELVRRARLALEALSQPAQGGVEVVAHGYYCPLTGAYAETQRTPRWLPAVVCAALPQPQPVKVYACDYCGCDYTDATYCCHRRRDYMAAHGQRETSPPPPSDAPSIAGQIADVAWDFLVAKGYTNEDFDAIPLTIIRDNLSQRKGEKAPPSDAAQGVPHVGLPPNFPVEILAAAKEGTPDYWLGYLAGRNVESQAVRVDEAMVDRVRAYLLSEGYDLSEKYIKGIVMAAHKGEGNG